MSFLIVVTGSRDWEDLSAVYTALSDTPEHAMFMEGGCDSGADLFTRMYCAKSLRPRYTEFAQWQRYKKAAGPKRNAKMLSFQPDLVIAFRRNRYKSPGTTDCVAQAEALKIPVRKIGDWS